MTENKFEEIIESTLATLKELLIVKGKEYRRNENPFHNFDIGASLTNQIPERVLDGMLLKHEISIKDLVNDIERGVKINESIVHEKFNDNLVYLLLKKALILRRLKD